MEEPRHEGAKDAVGAEDSGTVTDIGGATAGSAPTPQSAWSRRVESACTTAAIESSIRYGQHPSSLATIPKVFSGDLHRDSTLRRMMEIRQEGGDVSRGRRASTEPLPYTVPYGSSSVVLPSRS